METINPFSALESEPVATTPTQLPAAPVTTTAVEQPGATTSLLDDPPKSTRAIKRAKRKAAQLEKTEESANKPAEPKKSNPKPPAQKEVKKKTQPKAAPKKKEAEKKTKSDSKPKEDKTAGTEKETKIKDEPKANPPVKKPSKTDRVLVEPFAAGKEITPHMKDVFKNVLSDLRASYVTTVLPADVEWFQKLYGRDPIIDETGSIHGVNAHARLAVIRKMALVDMVTGILIHNPPKTLRERSIDFVYGTQARDDSVMKTINITLAKAGFGSETDPCILHHIVGEQLVPGDITRRVGGFGVRSKIAIMMDVYALGSYRMHPASIAGMGYDLWAWCGHVFNGPFGSYAGAIWCREGIDFSQVWYKADQVSDAYAVHDACDVMHRPGRTSHGDTSVVWTSINKMYNKEGNELVPVYNLILGQNSEKEFIDLHSKNMQPIDVVNLKVKCPIVETKFDFINNVVTPWLASVGVYKTRTIPISSAMYNDLKQVCVARFYNQWTFAAVLTDVTKYFNNLDWFKKLETALPQKFVNYRYEVASALYSEFCDAKKQNLLIMNAVHGSDMNVANEQFKIIGSEPPKLSIPKKVVLIGAGIFVAYLAYKKARQQSSRMTALKALFTTTNLIGFSYPEDLRPMRSQINRLMDGIAHKKYVPMNIPYISNFVNERIGKRIEAMDNVHLKRFMACGYGVLLGPVIEESVKHFIPLPLYKLLVSLLFANLDFVEGSPIDLTVYLTAFVKHFVCALLPLDTGIVIHGMVNFYALAEAFMLSEAGNQSMLCIGLNPCLKAILNRKTCEGRIIVDSSDHGTNFGSLTEFRNLVRTNPLSHIVNPCIIRFSPENESFNRSDLAVSKRPELIDSTTKLRTPNINYDNFSSDVNINHHDSGYYQIFAVSRYQSRPALNGYNTHQMLVNRLMKAPPNRKQIITKNGVVKQYHPRFGVPLAEPDHVYDVNRRLENLFENIAIKMSEGGSDVWNFIHFDRTKRSFKGYYSSRKAYGIKLTEVNEHTETDEGFDAWLKHMHGIKRSLYRRYQKLFEHSEVNITSRCVNRIEVSIKSDETLLKFDWTPRPVHRVDPEFACWVGKHIYAASVEGKAVYWFFPILHQGWLITLTFGSTLNVTGLSDWFFQATDDSNLIAKYPELLLNTLYGMIHIIVAGDDVLMVKSALNTYTCEILEADVSQCDHSTRYSQLEFEWAWLQLFGVPRRIISLLIQNSCAELRIRMPHIRDEYVVLDRGHERNTGGTDTTIGNSVCIGHSWMSAIIDQLDQTQDQKIHTELWHDIVLNNYGFDMKIQNHTFTSNCFESDTGTFLKGTWWHVITDGTIPMFQWGPLLSRLIKLSKIMTRPMSICRQNAPKSFPKHTKQATINELWYCMAQMVKSMEVFVWIPPVRNWFETIKLEYHKIAQRENLPLYDKVTLRHEDVTEFYKPQAAIQWKVWELDMCPCWKDRLAKRYGVTHSEIDNWSNHLQQVRPGTFSVHPFWDILAKVDYC